MSNSIPALFENLQATTMWINRILIPLQIAFGTFGNLFNIIVFTRPNLRTNPCVTYFLVNSINSMLVLYIALLTYYLSVSWRLNLATTDTVVCRIRAFFVYASLCSNLWLTVLACIDRYLSSSENVQFRRMSNVRTARKVIVSTIIFIYLIHSHIPIFFQLYMNGTVKTCSYLSYEYSIFLNFFLVITACLLPILLTSIFGILMIINIRKIRNRVGQQVNNARNERTRSSDRQLIRMLLFQVLITILITLPYSILSTYNIVAVTILKKPISALESEIFYFAFNILLLFYYMNPVLGFYIYTLTGSKFRLEVKRCTHYGLKSVLTATGLIWCLPLRTQQALLGQIQMNITNTMTLAPRKTENAVHPHQM